MISWFTICALLVALVVTTVLLRHYAMKTTSVLTIGLTFVSWLLAFGLIALVPFDVYLVRS